MKYHFDYSHMPDYVLIVTGEFALVEDFYKLLKDLTDSPQWIKDTNLIVDHRLLNLGQMTPEDVNMIRSIVEFHSDKLGAGKCAIIINGNLGHLSAEFYGQIASDLHAFIKIFSAPAIAREWILN